MMQFAGLYMDINGASNTNFAKLGCGKNRRYAPNRCHAINYEQGFTRANHGADFVKQPSVYFLARLIRRYINRK